MECKSIIQPLGQWQQNNLFVKREDLIPISFGGNKARKALLFFSEIDEKGYTCVVTYGSSSSNHCRIVANMAAMRKLRCYIISPEDEFKETYNTKMMRLFGADVITCPVTDVSSTIDKQLAKLEFAGEKPFFIPGGGHGNIGTHAFFECYQEIACYENEHKIHFDYIFHASGTGTTQAGLIAGKLISNDDRQIIGISIARKAPRGRDIVIQSVYEYLSEFGYEVDPDKIEKATQFLDDYIGGGYGRICDNVIQIINHVMIKHSIALDTTYTGKAFYGMQDFISKKGITDKNILFIHTGGTPLFFDYLNNLK